MKPHIKNYMDFFDLGMDDTPSCEICGSIAVDIHHIELKGMGGNSDADDIENLIGLCRHCHDIAHGKIPGKSLTREELFEIVERRK
jgi:5-methylcytosine-specific restriction endonuclease McrA